MARTLRNKYLSLYISVMESDPKHEHEIYHSSFGFIDSEWEWCETLLKEMKTSVESENRTTFNRSAVKLVQYLRYRFHNPAPKFQYPIPKYKLLVNEPTKTRNLIGFKLPEYSVFLVER